MSGGPSVEVRELVKRYPRSPVNAVDGISFAVEGGRCSACSARTAPARRRRSAMLTTRVLDRPGGEATSAGSTSCATRCALAAGSRSCRSAAISIVRSRSATTCCSTPPTTASRPRDRRLRADELLDQFGLLDRAK